MAATTSVQFSHEPRHMGTTRSAHELASREVAARRGLVDPAILTRIVIPVLIALAVIASLSRATAAATLVIFVAAFVVLDVAALTIGHDSRDGVDWRPGHFERLR